MKANFNTKAEIINYLTEKGFKQFEPPQFSRYAAACMCFQKKYRDEKGIKYFIDVCVYDFTTFNVPENYVIEYSGQYYQKETHNAINMEFLSWTIEEVEEYLNNLFDKGFLEHYEENC